jgi:hypothetical protein
MSITWNEMLNKTFERQIEIEKESILDYNSNIEEFINLSIQEDEINVILIYGVTNSKYFAHIYRMAIYPRTETKSIYREGNVIDNQGYNIEDVKKRAKTYLNHYANKL